MNFLKINKVFLFAFLGALFLLLIWKSNLLPNKKSFGNKTQTTEIHEREIDFKNGDLIFQTSLSSQSKAIQLATKSKYSHVGMIYKKDNQTYVLEAIQPVSLTPLQKWINRGENGHFVVKRLRNAESILTDEALKSMKKEGLSYLGKDYDIYFEWSDKKLYCSELVWKLYQQATGLEIGKLEQLSSFDLTSKEVKQIMEKRYGNSIPYTEKVISPVQMFNSELLETVYTN